MRYARLIDGALYPVRNPILVGQNWWGNLSAEALTALGYKPVRRTEPPAPTEDLVPVPGWEETAEEIVQTWTVEPEGELPEAEVLEILLGGV